jgi:diguanylate cyclase (GGDEF)-like protein
VPRMDVFLRIDINLFTAFYLVIVIYLAYHRLDHEDAFNRLFFRGGAVVLTMTIFEAITCILNHNPSPWMRGLSTVLHICLFAVAPLITYYWYMLADTLTRNGNVRDMRMKWPYLIPVFVVALITLLSPLFGLVFYISADGAYHRGVLFPIELIVSYGYLVAGFLMILKRRRKIMGLDFRFLTLFCLMPMVGGIIQGLIYGVLLMWAGSICALTILYMYLQERMVQTDYLTGAWTRPSFEYYLSQRLHAHDNQPFGVVYVDIDNLKHINDQFGHAEGDEAIRAATSAIKSVLRKGDVIARLGGDEFCVLLNLQTDADLNAVLGRIEGVISSYNQRAAKPYALSLSLGARVFESTGAEQADDIISRVDALMYANKRAKKAAADETDACACEPAHSENADEQSI